MEAGTGVLCAMRVGRKRKRSQGGVGSSKKLCQIHQELEKGKEKAVVVPAPRVLCHISHGWVPQQLPAGLGQELHSHFLVGLNWESKKHNGGIGGETPPK